MESRTERPSKYYHNNTGQESIVKFKKKRATSLDELTIPMHLITNPMCCKWDLSNAMKVSVDDCSMYVKGKLENKCKVAINGNNSSNAKEGLQKSKEDTRCICHDLFKEKHNQVKPCYDLVASPGPRFLLRPFDLEDSPFSASFKIPASVPFEWEEVPGKPRQDAASSKPDPSLQLPPRLLTKLSSNHFKSPGGSKSGKIRSYYQHRGSRNVSTECNSERPIFCYPLIFRSTELSFSERKPKHGFYSCEISSPTSILSGPLLKSTYSTSDPNSTSDSETSTLAATITETWSDLTVRAENASCTETESSVSRPDMQLVPYIEYNLSDLAPSLDVKIVRGGNRILQRLKSVVKFLRTSKRWPREKGKHNVKAFSEVELWAPTLATYFQGVDRSKSGIMIEKLCLLDNEDAEKRLAFEKNCQKLFSGDSYFDPDYSTFTACTCQCRDVSRKENELLSMLSAKNVAAALRSSHVHPAEKAKIIEDELREVFNTGTVSGNSSPSRFSSLSPSRIIPNKWGSRRVKLQARRSIEIPPRSLSVLVRAIRQPFASRRPDMENLPLNPICCLLASKAD